MRSFGLTVASHGHYSFFVFELLPLILINWAVVDIGRYHLVQVDHLFDLLRVVIEVIDKVIRIFIIVVVSFINEALVELWRLSSGISIRPLYFFTLKYYILFGRSSFIGLRGHHWLSWSVKIVWWELIRCSGSWTRLEGLILHLLLVCYFLIG